MAESADSVAARRLVLRDKHLDRQHCKPSAAAKKASDMAGKQQGGVPPGFDFGDQMPFDFSALQSVLNDPGIKAMAEQLARDPAFAQMTQSLQAGFGRDGPGPAAAGAGPAMDPETAAQAMSGMFQNPDFMHMAQELGQKIMTQDPGMHEMMNVLNQPNFQEKIAERMNQMKDDPEIATIMKDVETKGPAAMMDYWNNPDVMAKMSKVMGDVFTTDGLPAPGTSTAADDEEEEEDDGTPAVHNYASNGEADALKAEIANGANVDEADEEGRTALQFACGFGELECARVLLEANAKVDAVDKNKNTALHYAAGYGQKETVELLLKHNADKTKKNLDDKTPLGVAEINDKQELFDILK